MLNAKRSLDSALAPPAKYGRTCEAGFTVIGFDPVSSHICPVFYWFSVNITIKMIGRIQGLSG